MTTLLAGTARVESALHGPAHPDAFRVKVGRFGDRFYHDPLPACALAPVTDETWPSVTTIKKAAGGDWSWVSLERAAQYLATRRDELKGLNAAEIHARLNEVNKAGLTRAAGRGTAIHNAIEAMAAGQTDFPEMTAEALPYLPVARAFLDDHQPTWLFSEVVAISRKHRYGGTLDAILEIDGKTYLVDWKTRKPGKHGAYDEEAWQLAAYAGADYIIIGDSDGNAKRVPVPKLDGALIVSLTPEGYRLYPALLDEAWSSFLTLRALWDAQRVKVLAKPVILKPATAAALEPEAPTEDPTPILGTFDNQAKRVWLLGRAKALNEQGHGKSLKLAWHPTWAPPSQAHKWTDEMLEAIEQTLNAVERQCEAQFFPNPLTVQPGVDPFEGLPSADKPAPQVNDTPKPEAAIKEAFGATEIDEGATITADDVDFIADQIKSLTGDAATLVRNVSKAMADAGHPLKLKELRTQRRYAIAMCCLTWARVGTEDDLRAALGLSPEGNLGLALAFLTTQEAGELAAKAHPPKKTRAKKAKA